jgi:hypothetical protein
MKMIVLKTVLLYGTVGRRKIWRKENVSQPTQATPNKVDMSVNAVVMHFLSEKITDCLLFEELNSISRSVHVLARLVFYNLVLRMGI